MKCDEISVLLVDDRARRTPDVARHIRSCSECQALLAADARARELGRLDRVPALPPPDAWRGIGHRRGGRLALVAAGVLGAAALGAIIANGGGEVLHETPLVLASETEPLRAAASGPPAENSFPENAWTEEESVIDQLVLETAEYVRRDVTVRDTTYALFGDLPRWVSLPRNRSLDAPVFQKALYLIHPNLEVIR
jgi:hypothetical protein